MQAPKEVKQYVNRARRRAGKKNGVVKHLFEHYSWEILFVRSKKNYKRNKKVNYAID